jgi:DNA polymerase-3 subunit epsilon
LIAQLKEFEEVKKNKPILNPSRRNASFTHQLSTFTDPNGYINLKIEKADGRKKAYVTFNNYQQAKSALFKITEENQLCQKLTGLSPTKGNCFNYTLKECYGACLNEEPISEYNGRVQGFLEDVDYKNKDILIIDRGREVEERSVILIENGKYMGYGFYNLNYQITNPDVLKSILNVMPDSRDVRHLIQNYLRKNKTVKTIIRSGNKIK